MRGYATVLYGFCSRNFLILRRYPVNFVGRLMTYLLVFGLVFWGGMVIAPEGFRQSLDAIIVGYFLFATVFSTFFTLSNMINTEAQYGTLEQLYIAPFRFSTVMSAAVLSKLVISLFIGVVNLVVILLITGRTLTIDLLTVVPLLALTLCQAIGMGFFLGGFALLYKRIRSLYSIVQFVFVGLIAAAMSDAMWPRLLPVGQGTWMIHQAMTDGIGLFQFSLVDHAILVGTAVVYLFIGYASFHITQHRARQRGLLDDY